MTAAERRFAMSSQPSETVFVLPDLRFCSLRSGHARSKTIIRRLAGKSQPMDIEWAKDGITGELFILQARPETVHAQKTENYIETYELTGKHGAPLGSGVAVGEKIGQGTAHVMLDSAKLNTLKQGEIFVTTMTDPAWEPIMKRASAIVTERGGRTCHSAIISRELGIPCIVGTGDATEKVKTGNEITVSCAEGDVGNIYYGKVDFKVNKHKITGIERPKTQIMMNVGDPDHAFSVSRLPNDGVGLARLEFIINNHIGIHPMALVNYPNLRDRADVETISNRIREEDPKEFLCTFLGRRDRPHRRRFLSKTGDRANV